MIYYKAQLVDREEHEGIKLKDNIKVKYIF